MAELDFAEQKGVQELLIAAKKSRGKFWKVFIAELRANGIDETEASLRSMSRNKANSDRPGKIIQREFALRLIGYCKHIRDFTFPAGLKEKLGLLFDEAPAVEVAEQPEIDKTKYFISALGLVGGVNIASVKYFRGDYLQFSLNDQSQVITSRCFLEDKLGADLAPILSSNRMHDGSKRESSGAYFYSDKNLYLISSPGGSVDLRMSIFNAVSADDQIVRRGMVLGVTLSRTIIGSRCVLIPMGHLSQATEENLYMGPTPRGIFEGYMPKPPDDLSTISAFLFGEANVDYIRPMKLAVPPE